jgi:hypothetical protein
MTDADTFTYAKHAFELLTAIVGFIIPAIGLVTLIINKTPSGQNAAAILAQSNLSSDQQNVVLKTIKLWKFGGIICSVLLFLFSIGTLVWFLIPAPDQSTLSKYLARHDSRVFRDARDGNYDIARVFPNRNALLNETRLANTITETKISFDLVALHGLSVISDCNTEIADALKRGIAIRIIMADPTEVYQEGFDAFSKSIGHGDPAMLRGKIRDCLVMCKEFRQRIDSDKKTYPGTLEVRYLRRPILYSMWIKDKKDKDTAMCNVAVHEYRERGPEAFAFRFSNRACSRLMSSIGEQFEEIWKQAVVPSS